MMQHVRDVTDPEHPYTLEQLKVVSEDAITVKDKEGIVRCAHLELCTFLDNVWQTILLEQSEGAWIYKSLCGRPCKLIQGLCIFCACSVQFTPTVQHCSMATLIGLSLSVKLMQTLPSRFKVRSSI